jgi:hypothetical protein
MKVGKPLIEQVNKTNKFRELYKKEKDEHEFLKDAYGVLALDRDEWKDKYDKLQQGALLVYVDQDNYITNILPCDPYFVSTFKQDIPIELKNALGSKYYNVHRFGKLENGLIVIDKEKYNKFIGGIFI